MKAELTFNLDDYDDKIEHLRCVQATELCSAIHEFIYNTKKGLKNEAEAKNLDVYNAINSVYEKFWDILKEHNLDIDKLIQ
jgi:hypothetical protein